MNKGSSSTFGYTLVEVLIVLAVTGALLVSAAGLVSGQRQKAEFSQSIRDMESQIQDVINDVATGYYVNTANFQCRNSGGLPSLSFSASDTQGANKDCIFIGRAIQFGVAGTDREGYNIFNIMGLRRTSGGREVETLNEARPTAMARGTAAYTFGFPDTTDQRRLQYGLKIRTVRYNGINIGAVGLFGQLASYSTSTGNLISGAQTVDLVPIPGSALDVNKEGAVDRINAMSTTPIVRNPSSGVQLCFESGGTNNFGIITIGGGSSRQLTTSLEIGQGVCP